MSKNYFLVTSVDQWSITDAFQQCKKDKEARTVRLVLGILKKQIEEVSESSDGVRATAAKKLLKDWKSVKSMFICKPLKEEPKAKYTKITNYGVMIIEPQQPVVLGNNLPLKRYDGDDDEGSSDWSWKSTDAKKNNKKKYMKIYLSNAYDSTTFGGEDDEHDKWIVDNINLTSILRQYRMESIKGAQMRQNLSDSRVLSLSFIFLLSPTSRCVLSTLSPKQQTTVLKALKIKANLNRVDNDVVSACRDMQVILEDEDKEEEDKEYELDSIKRKSNNPDVKTAVRIVSNLQARLQSSMVPSNQKEGEASQIIEAIRPFAVNCIIKQIQGIKHEWMTYHVVPHHAQRTHQIMIPDLTLFVDPFSGVNFELCFFEVKRPGNTTNGHLEKDMVKLGKEMQVAVTKLVLQRVESPEVVGVLVEGYNATAYKMDLAYTGQYRMVQLSKFRLLDTDSADILVIPSVLEKLNQIKTIVERTMNNLYSSIEMRSPVDATMYIRPLCDNPIAAKVDQ